MLKLIKKYYEWRSDQLDSKYHNLNNENKILKRDKKNADEKGNLFSSFLYGWNIRVNSDGMSRLTDKICKLEMRIYQFGGLK